MTDGCWSRMGKAALAAVLLLGAHAAWAQDQRPTAPQQVAPAPIAPSPAAPGAGSQATAGAAGTAATQVPRGPRPMQRGEAEPGVCWYNNVRVPPGTRVGAMICRDGEWVPG